MKLRALCSILLLLGLLSGCSSAGTAGGTLPLGQDGPSVPAPAQGSLGSVEDQAVPGGWIVLWEDLPEAGFSSYVDALGDAGWTPLYAQEGAASTTGVLLEKDDVGLSMAYSEPSLTILILPASGLSAAAP